VRSTSALLGALSAGLLVSLGAAIPLARGEATPSTMPFSDIKEGMKGYGLSVFHGTEPERFNVEVIGLLHNFRPGEPIFVVMTGGTVGSAPTDKRLELAKGVHGMSGSPIYLEGKLAGAYSYSMSNFAMEPVAGVTPIDLMLTEMRRPIPPGFWPIEHAPPLPGAHPNPIAPHPQHASLERFEGPPGSYDAREHARQLADRLGTRPDPGNHVTRATTPLMMAGVGERTSAAFRQLVEPLGLEVLQGGGSTGNDPAAPVHFVNGGGLGVQFVRGDVSILGYGTATYADGAGKVAGFGHPLLGGGDEALPACIVRILWINASAQSSNKVGECVRSLGTLVQDRQTAIVVDENVAAPTFPVEIEVIGATGAPKTKWRTEVTDDKFLGAAMTSVVFGSAVEATVMERRDLTWKMTSRIDVAGHGLVETEDVGVASGGSPDTSDWIRSHVTATVGDVLNNPWEHARIRGVEARLEVRYTRDLLRLRGAELLDPVVDAGAKARVRLHLVPREGPETTRVVEVTIPTELAGKDVEVEIVPGYEVAPELAAPESLDQMLANEPHVTAPPRTIVLQFRVPSQGIAYRGHVTQRLPTFMLDTLRTQSSDTGPEAFPSWSRTIVPTDEFIEGRDKVKVKVRSVVR
jgi:hypothetical protein